MFNAILTGSHAYGTPTEGSDIDIVVLLSDDDAEKIRGLDEETGGSFDRTTEDLMPLRFGDLNLLVTTKADYFAAWKEGTDALKERAPVPRREAIVEFQARFSALEAARGLTDVAKGAS